MSNQLNPRGWKVISIGMINGELEVGDMCGGLMDRVTQRV